MQPPPHAAKLLSNFTKFVQHGVATVQGNIETLQQRLAEQQHQHEQRLASLQQNGGPLPNVFLPPQQQVMGGAAQAEERRSSHDGASSSLSSARADSREALFHEALQASLAFPTLSQHTHRHLITHVFSPASQGSMLQLSVLRHLAFDGIPDQPGLRILVWKALPPGPPPLSGRGSRPRP